MRATQQWNQHEECVAWLNKTHKSSLTLYLNVPCNPLLYCQGHVMWTKHDTLLTVQSACHLVQENNGFWLCWSYITCSTGQNLIHFRLAWGFSWDLHLHICHFLELFIFSIPFLKTSPANGFSKLAISLLQTQTPLMALDLTNVAWRKTCFLLTALTDQRCDGE